MTLDIKQEFALQMARQCGEVECTAAGVCPEPPSPSPGTVFNLPVENMGPRERFCLLAEKALNRILYVRFHTYGFLYNLRDNEIVEEIQRFEDIEAIIAAEYETADPNPNFTNDRATGSLLRNYPIWDEYKTESFYTRQNTGTKYVGEATRNHIQTLPGELPAENITVSLETLYREIFALTSEKRILIDGIGYDLYETDTPEDIWTALSAEGADWLYRVFETVWSECTPGEGFQWLYTDVVGRPFSSINGYQTAFLLPFAELTYYTHPTYGHPQERQGFIHDQNYMVQIDFGQWVDNEYVDDVCNPPVAYTIEGDRQDWAWARAGVYDGDPLLQPNNSTLAAECLALLEFISDILSVPESGRGARIINTVYPYSRYPGYPGYEVTILKDKGGS